MVEAGKALARVFAQQQGDDPEKAESEFVDALIKGERDALQLADAARDILRAARRSHREAVYASPYNH